MINGTISYDMDEALYHAHSSLSSTGARRLLDSPAKFHYAQTHPQKSKLEFDIGHAVHGEVLGVGSPLAVIPTTMLAKNGAASTIAAKNFIEKARSEGKIPIKEEDARLVRAMSQAVLRHPTASALFHQEGAVEASVFGTDPVSGAEVRARFDFLPAETAADPMAVDLKTTAKSASKIEFEKSIVNFGYDVQDRWYTETLQFVTGRDEFPFLFVVVEVEPPHLVGLYQIDHVFRRMGHEKAARARDLFAACTASGEWPGLPVEVQLASPPTYAVMHHEELFGAAE